MLETPIFTGQIIYPSLNLYARLLFPLAGIQKIYKVFYHFLLKLIWNELIHDKTVDNELISLALFFCFWIFALLIYYLRTYIPYLILLSFIFWYIDYYIAKKHYLTGKYNTSVNLTKDAEETITWSTQVSKHKLLKSDFIADQIANISISRKPIYGGAFQENLGKVWQVELQFWDGSDLVVYEHPKLVEVLKNARYLSEYLKINVIFADSQGYGNYIEANLEEEFSDFSSSFRLQKNTRKWHIMTQWQGQNSWLLLERIFQESGFSFFVVLMTQVMTKVGQFLDWAIQTFNQQQEIIIVLPNIFTAILHDDNILGLINGFLALGLMVYQGWRLSRAKHITIDKHYLKYAIDNKKMDRIETSTIETILLLQAPDLAILIIGEDKAIIFEEFQRLEDCQAFLQQIVSGVRQFQTPADLE